jgi:hypothetical protein
MRTIHGSEEIRHYRADLLPIDAVEAQQRLQSQSSGTRIHQPQDPSQLKQIIKHQRSKFTGAKGDVLVAVNEENNRLANGSNADLIQQLLLHQLGIQFLSSSTIMGI